MEELIKNKIDHMISYFGYTKQEATEIITKALNNIINGNKSMADLFSIEELKKANLK